MYSKTASINLNGKTTQIQIQLDSAGSSINLQLSSAEDLFFLFSLAIREEEYLVLKSSQNLLVDFHAFPGKLIELLNSAYSIQLDTASNPTLKIVETNSFKQITHIELFLVKADDANLKQYLANLVSTNVNQLDSLKVSSQETIQSLHECIDSQSKQVTALSASVEQMKNEILDLKVSQSNQLANQKQEFMKQSEDLNRSKEYEKRQIEIRHEEEVRNLSQQLTAAQTAFQHQSNHSASQHDAIAMSAKQIDCLTQELATIRYDNDKLQQAIRQADKDSHELELAVQKYREGLDRAERKCMEKEESARRVGSLLEDKSNGYAMLEQQLRECKNVIENLENKLRLGEDEVRKANAIIQKLQADNKSTKTKLKLKSEVVAQQDKLLDEKTHSMDLFQKDLNQFKENLLTKQDTLAQTQQKLEETTRKLEESKALIKDNNHVIEWLHKQLNEDALHMDLEKYAPASSLRRIDYQKYTKTPDLKPAANHISRPTSVLKSPNRAFKPASSPLHPHQNSKVSASNMATGASHLSAVNGYSGSTRAVRPTGENGALKSNYFN